LPVNDDWNYQLHQQLTASWYLAKAFVPGIRDRWLGLTRERTVEEAEQH